jgi:hypothetical protein
MVLGQEVNYLSGRYRVMGVRDVDGVQCFALKYQGGVRYLPVIVPCEGWGGSSLTSLIGTLKGG